MKNAFEKRILDVYGQRGKEWIERLPDLCTHLKQIWNLSNLQPVENMTYHYVAKAVKNGTIPVVIKIGCDEKLLQNEAMLLKLYHKNGAIELLDFQKNYLALLLEQAIPGYPLQALYQNDPDFVIKKYVETAKKIHVAPGDSPVKFPTISQWLEVLNRADSSLMDKKLIKLAVLKKKELISSMHNIKLLHGDLHLDNILGHKKSWVCIDPKGVMGELGFELAAFDLDENQTPQKILQTIHKLATVAGLPKERLKDWFFIRLVLSAIWFIEDNEDPKKPLKLASTLFQ